MDTDHELEVAIAHWTTGEPLPVDIAARLVESGYDIEALEAQYAI